MISSTDSGCIQTSFDKLTGLFDRVWLKMNVQKTVRVVCHPLREFGLWEDKTYTWRMDAGGPDFALHIQCGGGRSGPPLIIPGGGRGWGR